VQKAQEADLHRLAGALLDYETLSTAEIRQVCERFKGLGVQSEVDVELAGLAYAAGL
jgi:uncharacterized membrane protein